QLAGAAPLPEQSTQILADALLAKTSPQAAGETNGRGAVPTELPAQPTVILEGGTGSTALPAIPPTASPYAPTMSAMNAVPPPTSGPLAAVVGASASVILGDTNPSPPYGSQQVLRSAGVSGVR